MILLQFCRGGTIVKITVSPDGPYIVEGDDVLIIDWNGHEYVPINRARFALCRCGGSANKPFCDSTHARIGFRAAQPAHAADAMPD